MALVVDPIAGEPYHVLPWSTIPIAALAEQRMRETVAVTHYRLVGSANTATTATDRLRALGMAAGECISGLDADDGVRLGDEWTALLADLATARPERIWGWAALYGEGTGGWWPQTSSVSTRGIVNAILRSPFVELLHTTTDRVTWLDNQLGTMCLLWAGVSLLEGLVDPHTPESWGASASDAEGCFSAASDLFPATLPTIEALGRALQTGAVTMATVDATSGSDVDLAKEAWQRLVTTGDDASDPEVDDGSTQPWYTRFAQRGAWSPPTAEDLEYFAE